jgi:long-chain acyl-CoA synthetase
MDVVNRISTRANEDAAHRIYFSRGGAIESMSLADLDRSAASVARHLHHLGVRPRDRIGVMAKNCVEWVILDLAILKLGAVVAGFETGRFEARSMVQLYGLKLLFVDDGSENASNTIALAAVADWARDEQRLRETAPFHRGYAPDDICAIKFTSGSTGLPKGLEATVGSVNDSLSSVEKLFGHGNGDNILVFLRLALLQQRYWIYSALAYGHDVTVTTMDEVLPVAQAVGPTVIMGVPGFFDGVKAKIENAPGYEPQDIDARQETIQRWLGGRIRYLWTGSAPASRALLDFYNACGVPLFEGYGLNETCIVAKNCPSAFRIGSVGKLLPNKIVDFDADGILIVGSDHPVNTHYSWCAPGDNEKMFLPDGRVKTHDIGYFDDDGYLYILGRADDIITLSSGRNVLVRPLEERLREHPDVRMRSVRDRQTLPHGDRVVRDANRERDRVEPPYRRDEPHDVAGTANPRPRNRDRTILDRERVADVSVQAEAPGHSPPLRTADRQPIPVRAHRSSFRSREPDHASSVR